MIPAFIFVAILLLLGVGLRLRFSIFRWLYIPASVLAGMLGLLITQIDLSATVTAHTSDWTETLKGWPGFLIAVIFAGMLLERKPAPWRNSIPSVAELRFCVPWTKKRLDAREKQTRKGRTSRSSRNEPPRDRLLAALSCVLFQ